MDFVGMLWELQGPKCGQNLLNIHNHRFVGKLWELPGRKCGHNFSNVKDIYMKDIDIQKHRSL